MTKKLRVAIAAVLMFGVVPVYAQTYQKGDKLLNAGVGVGGGFGIPIGVSYEHGFTERISGGAYLGYGSESNSFEGFGKWKYSHILAVARASYHFKVDNEKFDPYVGATLGYNIVSVKWKGEENTEPAAAASSSGVVFGGYVGSRYWFSNKVGAFAELGYGIGILNLGVAFKL